MLERAVVPAGESPTAVTGEKKQRQLDLEGLTWLLVYARREAEGLGLDVIAHHLDLAIEEAEAFAEERAAGDEPVAAQAGRRHTSA